MVVLVPLVLLIIYQGDWLYLLLVSVAVVMMQVEYCRLAQHFTEKLNPVIPVLLTGVFCLFAYFLPTLSSDATRASVTQVHLCLNGNIQLPHFRIHLCFRGKYL